MKTDITITAFFYHEVRGGGFHFLYGGIRASWFLKTTTTTVVCVWCVLLCVLVCGCVCVGVCVFLRVCVCVSGCACVYTVNVVCMCGVCT